MSEHFTRGQRSMELLDALVELGYTDDVHRRMHHRPRDTIAAHRRYCAEPGRTFRPDGQNARFQRRLALVYAAYRAGGFPPGEQRVLEALADVARRVIPPVEQAQAGGGPAAGAGAGDDPMEEPTGGEGSSPPSAQDVPPDPDGPGLYVVEPLNALPIPVQAQDSRAERRDRAVRVTYEHRKIGRARRFPARARDYEAVFGPDNYIFRPVVAVADPARVEGLILAALDAYRLRGETGRPHEWLGGMTTAGIEAAVFDCLVREGITYTDVRPSDIATDNTPGTVMGEAEQTSAGRTG